MIRSFGSKETEKIWNGVVSKKLPIEIQALTRRKLRMINNAQTLNDLRIPPGHQLEKLKGNRQGQFSVRINDQCRICFTFENGNCFNVEIADYH
jgi:proteic killer suppression protein